MCVFHLILVGIPCSLILSVRRGDFTWKWSYVHQLSMTKIICWWPLTQVTFVLLMICWNRQNGGNESYYPIISLQLKHLKLFRLASWGLGVLGEFVKSGIFVTKLFFQIMLNEVLKCCKKICCNKRTGSSVLSRLISSVKNRRVEGFYLIKKNLFCVMNYIFVNGP